MPKLDVRIWSFPKIQLEEEDRAHEHYTSLYGELYLVVCPGYLLISFRLRRPESLVGI